MGFTFWSRKMLRESLTLGDSHEYDDAIEPFDKSEIDELILGYLSTFLESPELMIASRWHGIYSRHPAETAVILHPRPGVTVRHGCRRRWNDAVFWSGRASCRPGAGRGQGLIQSARSNRSQEMSIELVVFDMAGTTVNDDDAVSRCVQASLAAVGVTVAVADVNRVMGIPKPEAIRILISESPRSGELIDRIDEIHDDFVSRSIRFYATDPSVREVAGAERTFRALKEAGIKVALNTGFSRAITQTILDRLSWTESPLIDAVISSDEVPRGRPHPDMIQALMQRSGLTTPPVSPRWETRRPICRKARTPAAAWWWA